MYQEFNNFGSLSETFPLSIFDFYWMSDFEFSPWTDYALEWTNYLSIFTIFVISMIKNGIPWKKMEITLGTLIFDPK